VDLVIESAKALEQGKYFVRLGDCEDVEKEKELISKEYAGLCLYHSRHLK